MAVILIDPTLTHETAEARVFVEAWLGEIRKHLPVTLIDSTAAARVHAVGSGDHILFINRGDRSYSAAVVRLLHLAAESNAEIYPVAVTLGERRPPDEVVHVQSFDVTEELERRNLERAQIPVVAVALAQTVVARSQPTLSKEYMQLFLSHRRVDGEEITRGIWDQLIARGQARRVFRDLADVRVGEDAQAIIMERLAQSDTVVFIDTPRCGESSWIARELESALALNLPIVWVRIGGVEGRVPLRVIPGEAPHLDLSHIDPAEPSIEPGVADQILDAAFAVSRETAVRIFETIDRLERLEQEGRIRLRLLDPAQMLYEVTLPRIAGRYAERPRRQLVQFFGRSPTDEDTVGFGPCASNVGFDPHPTHGPHYDAAVLAAPIPTSVQPPMPRDAGGLACYVDAADAYVSQLEEMSRPVPAQQGWGVILSGAFPDVAPEHEQEVKNAVHAFVLAIFRRGGSVIFGGHPTFQPMIFQIGRDHLPTDRVERTRLYVSGYFLTEAAAGELNADAVTTWVAARDGDRGRSLTGMRQAMINDPRARALVAIGGRGPSSGRSPGVDEEVQFAGAARMPIFLIGGAGGRTATLATERRAAGWQPSLNALSAEQNEELYQSREYALLAEMVLASLGV